MGLGFRADCSWIRIYMLLRSKLQTCGYEIECKKKENTQVGQLLETGTRPLPPWFLGFITVVLKKNQRIVSDI
jgi:hypothetical protein